LLRPSAGNAAFTALASCAAQCIPTAGTQALGLIAEFEQAIQVDAPFKKHCSFLKKAACAVGIAGAISACGGPEDLVCILKILSALHGCAEWYVPRIKKTHKPALAPQIIELIGRRVVAVL
jgi:hypothetical protein